MTTGQNQSTTFSCPRCGGPMYKPAGSPFYWHASNNHPPCTITNVADRPETVASTSELPDKSSKEQTKKNRLS